MIYPMVRDERAKSRCYRTACITLVVLLFLCACTAVGVLLWITIPHQRLPGPYTIFKTEPSFVPSNIKVLRYTRDRHLLEPGYFFIAPHIVGYGFGPQIVDHDGHLIWYGTSTVSRFKGYPVYAAPIFVCDFMGQKMRHLCYSETHPSGYEAQDIREGGAHRIFDETYQQVGREFNELGDLGTTPNAHEFNMLPGGETFIQAVSPLRKRDLSAFYGPRDGWIEDGCFQEVDIFTRSVIFQWCFSDHYEPSTETYFFLDVPQNTVNISNGGKGTKTEPWDFMHINAIDKNVEGDFLVSGRHISQILKIAGPNSSSGLRAGTTIWRLNGRNSDFKFLQEDARFARSHHCRYVSTGQNETLISLFNNAFNGSYTHANSSNAMILRLNNVTMEASLEAIYQHPKNRISYAQGSASVLSSDRGNMFVGWGRWPEWSEFARDGTLLYHAKTWADRAQYKKRLTNYRAFKFPWIGRPHYPPKIIPYTKHCPTDKSSAPLVAYVSWNGATEVGQWRFYTSETSTGLRTPVGSFDKIGFETKVQLSSSNTSSNHAVWVTVEAISKTDGHTVLGTASSRTFIPPSRWREDCDSQGCFHDSRFKYNAVVDGLRCHQQPVSSKIIQLVLLVFLLESVSYLFVSAFANQSIKPNANRAGHYARLDGL